MSQLTVIRDPNIEKEEIIHALVSPGPDELSDVKDNFTQVQQTKVYGQLMPLLSINNITIDYKDLKFFELDDTNMFPSIKFEFLDNKGTFKNFNHSGNDNEVRV